MGEPRLAEERAAEIAVVHVLRIHPERRTRLRSRGLERIESMAKRLERQPIELSKSARERASERGELFSRRDRAGLELGEAELEESFVLRRQVTGDDLRAEDVDSLHTSFHLLHST